MWNHFILPKLRCVSSFCVFRYDKTDLISFILSEIIYFPTLPSMRWCEYFTSLISSISLKLWNSVATNKECWLVPMNILEQLFFCYKYYLNLLFSEGFFRLFVCCFIFSGFLFVYHNFIRILLCVTRTVIVLYIMLWIHATYLPSCLSLIFQTASLSDFIQKGSQGNCHGYVEFLKGNMGSSLL